MSETQDENPPPPPPPATQQTPTQQTPHTVSTIKLPILKKGEYDIWAMKMEHYLAHTDYPIWEVIQNGNGPVSVTTDTSGQLKILPPKTAEEVVARERERKARTTLLMAIPEDHLAKFHKMTDAKEILESHQIQIWWNTNESKKMQNFEIHEQLSTEGCKQKFLRSLPSACMKKHASYSCFKSIKLSSLDMRLGPGFDEYVPVKKGLEMASVKISIEKKNFTKRPREQLSDASVEIKAYTQGLKKVEAQLVAHQQGQLWDKFGLGYGDYRYSGILSYENEVFQSVFKSNKSDFENPPLHKRLVKTCEMQAVPPPMTGNYLPSGPDIEIDDSQYTYGPEKTQPSESESQTTELEYL
ncbi:hypothetical protein Tco_0918990 [Tanacetum coccineum]